MENERTPSTNCDAAFHPAATLEHQHMSDPLPTPERVLAALASLRQRLRRLFLADGCLSVAIGLCAALGLSFALDYALTLPVGVRTIFVVSGVAGLIYILRRDLGVPLLLPVTDDDLANLVEKANPELRQALVSAVELTRAGNEAAAYVSRSMIEDVVKKVEEEAPRVDFGRIFSLGRFSRKAILAGVSVLILLAGALGDPQLTSIWFRRNLLLTGDRWPKQTELELVAPKLPAIVAMGDSLEVAVRAIRGAPREVVLNSWGADRSEKVDVLSETTSGLFRKVFDNVSRPFQFNVKGGDDEMGPFDVEVKLRPRIDMQSIRIWCEFPPYTKVASTPEDQPIRHGNLKVPVGTKVRYQMSTNVPVRKVYFVFRSSQENKGVDAKSSVPSEGDETPGSKSAPSGDAPPDVRGAVGPVAEGPWPDKGAVELAISAERDFAGQFQVLESGQYYFQCESADAFRTVKPERFRLEALPDRKPIVRITEPERLNEEVSPDALVTIGVSANDDYGVGKGSIDGLYFTDAEGKGIAHSLPLDAFSSQGEDAAEGRRAVQDEVTLQISDLKAQGQDPPKPGGRFQFFARVWDLGGNIGESQVHFLQVVDKEDLMRILSDQLMILRDQLKEAERKQASARKDLGELRGQTVERGKISREDAPKLYRHRQEQMRVTQALEREAENLSQILRRSEKNNVGDEKWRSWLEGLSGDIRQVSQSKSPEVERSLEKLRQSATESPQDLTRLNAIEEAQKEVERDLENLVLRLSEFGDMNALIQMLREVRRLQVEVRDDTRSMLKGGAGKESSK